MPCLVNSGGTVTCGSVSGGIKGIYFCADQVNLPLSTSWDVQNDRLDDWDSGTETVYYYEVRPENSSLSISINGERQTGAYYYEQVLNVVLHNVQPEDFGEINELANAAPNIFVLLNNDEVILLGAQYGMYVTGGSYDSGTAYTDAQQLEIEFTGRETTMGYYITKTAGEGTTNYPFDAVTATITIS